MKVKRGDIYWITKNHYRPTTGSVQEPGRPGIIVSNDANNACALTFEIVYVTSKPKKSLPTHCNIDSTGNQQELAYTQEEINKIVDSMRHMEKQLMVVSAQRDLLQKMYDSLLERTMA